MEYRPTERISAYEFLSWIRKPISFNAIIIFVASIETFTSFTIFTITRWNRFISVDCRHRRIWIEDKSANRMAKMKRFEEKSGRIFDWHVRLTQAQGCIYMETGIVNCRPFSNSTQVKSPQFTLSLSLSSRYFLAYPNPPKNTYFYHDTKFRSHACTVHIESKREREREKFSKIDW